MDKKILAAVMAIFIMGWLCGSVYSEAIVPAMAGEIDIESPSFISNQDQKSPYDWIKENQIKISEDGVFIDIENPTWAKFAPTRSMDPVIDEGAHAIQIIPKSMDEVHEGDIISYEVPYSESLVIHRVIRKGRDDFGEYLIVKGDNNQVSDPGRVRFSQVKKVLVAIIY